VCRFRFYREPGYYFGVVTPILPMLALGFAVVMAAIAYIGFHADLRSVIFVGGVSASIGLILFFRTAIAIYIAVDHAIDPPRRREESER
jgi:hypothetical protein